MEPLFLRIAGVFSYSWLTWHSLEMQRTDGSINHFQVESMIMDLFSPVVM